MQQLELWGGPECTVNRVGNAYGDQLVLTGHDCRDADLDRIAALGVRAVRYPVLWERVSPERTGGRDWGWSDQRLQGLRERGIRPIVGLVHHGSGPSHTSLTADDFAPGVARHARAVAERYPWVRDWTPINEPCTTARFACLYGHWYPHVRDEGAFWRALLNQVDATRFAMREIRTVNPEARLIQTDDLGRTYATVGARDQAAFDNMRRWMGWDLLVGRVTAQHPLWHRLCEFGFEDRLYQIADAPCPPDVIGVNHYLTSDRFLDHRVKLYPPSLQGGSHVQRYADTEAVRVLDPPPPGIEGVLREAWSRYRIPLAITEVHNGCTREEQMRWACDAWHATDRLRRTGVEVEAVTAWALFGSSGWNTLLTAPGVYEPGAYDVSGEEVRPTALVPLLQSLAAGGTAHHPVLQGHGWWRRDIRLHHARVARPAPIREHVPATGLTVEEAEPRPVLITGATGTLGGALAAACRHRHIAHVLTSRAELDLSDDTSICAALDRWRPWVVVNAAGWVRVDDAEGAVPDCMAANAAGAARLARACDDRGIATVGFSSDLVFDGSAGRPYIESDRPAPLNVYGRSKAEAEAAISALAGTHLMVRTAAFFSPFDRYNFAVHAAEALARGERFAAADDQYVSPTYVPDLCNAVLDLAIDGERGIWHLANEGEVSWAEFACRIADALGYDRKLVDPMPGVDLGWRAKRPAYVPLATRRGANLPPLEDALRRFASEIHASGRLNVQVAA
jgi:dTDP-4-dehydrorhamnose reductase